MRSRPRWSRSGVHGHNRNVRPLLAMDTSADRDTALEQAENHLKMRNIAAGRPCRAM